jgi:hypothetical protein
MIGPKTGEAYTTAAAATQRTPAPEQAQAAVPKTAVRPARLHLQGDSPPHELPHQHPAHLPRAHCQTARHCGQDESAALGVGERTGIAYRPRTRTGRGAGGVKAGSVR